MGEAAVSPEVTVADAESETNDIEVGKCGTQYASKPDTLWYFGATEAGSDR